MSADRQRQIGQRGQRASGNRSNWLIDAGLFAGFVVAMLLDLTGLTIHEWLGAGVTVVAAYHLIVHWGWVKSITARFPGQVSQQARRFWAIDAGLALGFLAIGITGLVISTWLGLPLDSSTYLAWRDAHVYVSIAALGLLVLKIGLHWRWIVTVAERHVFGRPAPEPRLAGHVAARPAGIGRREFVRLMGGVGATAALAATSALVDFGGPVEASASQAQASSVTPTATNAATGTATPSATTSATATATKTTSADATTASSGSSTTTSTCSVRCARRCSYPGQCRRYTDSNGNRRCDLGECI